VIQARERPDPEQFRSAPWTCRPVHGMNELLRPANNRPARAVGFHRAQPADRGAGGAVGDVLRYWLPPCGCRMVRSHAVAGLVITGNWLPDAAA
jgi:hypothetical protein